MTFKDLANAGVTGATPCELTVGKLGEALAQVSGTIDELRIALEAVSASNPEPVFTTPKSIFTVPAASATLDFSLDFSLHAQSSINPDFYRQNLEKLLLLPVSSQGLLCTGSSWQPATFATAPIQKFPNWKYMDSQERERRLELAEQPDTPVEDLMKWLAFHYVRTAPDLEMIKRLAMNPNASYTMLVTLANQGSFWAKTAPSYDATSLCIHDCLIKNPVWVFYGLEHFGFPEIWFYDLEHLKNIAGKETAFYAAYKERFRQNLKKNYLG